jgi:tetratricopeptide (TPR) repeat protein
MLKTVFVYLLQMASLHATVLKKVPCDFEQAFKDFQQSDNSKAIEGFQACLQNPDLQVQSQFYLAITYRNIDDFKQAEYYLHAILGKDNNNVNYYLEFAYTFEKQGQLKKAIKAYKLAVREHQNNIPARLGQARLNHWLGNINLSINQYQSLKIDHPDDISVNLGLAFALMADRKLTASTNQFKVVLKLNDKNLEAKNGLQMLKAMNNNQLSFSSDYISFGENSSKAEKMSFISTPDYSLKWGAHLIHYQNPIDTFSIDAVTTNRFVLNEYSLFGIYKTSEKNEILAQYSLLDLYENNHLHKIKLEDYYNISTKTQLSLGVTQSFINSELTNILTTFGISMKRKNKLEISSRFFYSADKYFSDSQSLSTSVIKTTKNNNRYQFGTSLNQTQGNLSTTVFGKITQNLSNNIKFTANAARNIKDQYTQVSIGFNYEF